MARNKANDPPPDNTPAAPNDRPRRANRGTGGRVARMASISEKLTRPQRPKKTGLETIPASAPVNPMAPPAAKPRRTKKTVPNSEPSDSNALATQAPDVPTQSFMVPPGTEPSLNGPRSPRFQLANGGRFGLQTGNIGSVAAPPFLDLPTGKPHTPSTTPTNQPSAGNSQKRQTGSHHSPVIDPNLNGERSPVRPVTRLNAMFSQQSPSTTPEHQMGDYRDPVVRSNPLLQQPSRSTRPKRETLQSQSAPHTPRQAPPQRQTPPIFTLIKRRGPLPSQLTEKEFFGVDPRPFQRQPVNVASQDDQYVPTRPNSVDLDDEYEGRDFFSDHEDWHYGDGTYPPKVKQLDGNEEMDEGLYEEWNGVEDGNGDGDGEADENGDGEADEDGDGHADADGNGEGDEDTNVEADRNSHPKETNVFTDDGPDDDNTPGRKRKRIKKNLTEQHNNHSDKDIDINDDDTNVLQEHRKRNKGPRPPNPQRLQESATTQSRLQGLDTSANAAGDETPMGDNVSNGNVTDDNNDSDNSQPVKKRAKRHSKTTRSETGLPTQLKFYPPQWSDVLEKAKQRYRLYLATVNAFPHRKNDRQQANFSLMEAIAAHDNEGGMIEPRFFEDHEQDMTTLIYQEGSTFRGRMKDIALTIVTAHYNLFSTTPGLSRQKYTQYTANRVRKLLSNGEFHKNGKDNNNRTNNFAHDALRELCIEFYYNRSEGLAAQFPDEFYILPREALCLAATCLRHCLEEWSTGTRIMERFNGVKYGKVYKAIQALLNKVEEDDYHSDKLQASLKDWARSGGCRAGLQDNENPEDFGLSVDLD